MGKATPANSQKNGGLSAGRGETEAYLDEVIIMAEVICERLAHQDVRRKRVNSAGRIDFDKPCRIGSIVGSGRRGRKVLAVCACCAAGAPGLYPGADFADVAGPSFDSLKHSGPARSIETEPLLRRLP